MINQIRQPRHGELDIKNNPEAYQIWKTRNDELPLILNDVDKYNLSNLVVDNNDYSDVDYEKKFWSNISRLLKIEQNVIYLRFVMEFTLDECGVKLFFTKERIRQIESHALRKLKYFIYCNKKIDIPEKYTHDIFWFKQYDEKRIERVLINKAFNKFEKANITMPFELNNLFNLYIFKTTSEQIKNIVKEFNEDILKKLREYSFIQIEVSAAITFLNKDNDIADNYLFIRHVESRINYDFDTCFRTIMLRHKLEYETLDEYSLKNYFKDNLIIYET